METARQNRVYAAQEIIDSVIDKANPRYNAICNGLEQYLNCQTIDAFTGKEISPLHDSFLKEYEANEVAWVAKELDEITIEEGKQAAIGTSKQKNPVLSGLKYIGNKISTFLDRHPSARKYAPQVAAVGAVGMYLSGMALSVLKKELSDDSPEKIFHENLQQDLLDLNAGASGNFTHQNYESRSTSLGQEVQITNDKNDQIAPSIYGSKIVWQDNRNGNEDIYMYDLETGVEKQITKDTHDQMTPKIYGDTIVWKDNRNGDFDTYSTFDIYSYNLKTGVEKRITTGDANKENFDIYEGRVVWNEDRNGDGNNDIYLHDLNIGLERQITNNPYAQALPAIYEDKIVYQDLRPDSQFDCYDYNIYMYNISTSKEKQITNSINIKDVGDQLPKIYEDKITYVQYDNTDHINSIYVHDLKTGKAIKIADTDKKIDRLDMRNGYVAWEENWNVESDYEYNLFLYNLKTGEKKDIANKEGVLEVTPSIYENKVAWSDNRNGDFNIFMSEIKDSTSTNQPPTIDIKSPSEGAVLDELVKISGIAADDSLVNKVEIKFDNGNWMDVTGTTDWAKDFKANQFTIGEHTLYARSFDGEKYSAIDSVKFVTKQSAEPVDLTELLEKFAPVLVIPKGNELPNNYGDADKFNPATSEVFYDIKDYTHLKSIDHPDGFYVLQYLLIFSKSDWRGVVKHDGDGERIAVWVDAKTKEGFLWSGSFHEGDIYKTSPVTSWDLEFGSNGPVPSGDGLMAWGDFPVDWTEKWLVLTKDNYRFVPLAQANPYSKISGLVGQSLGDRANHPMFRDEVRYPHEHFLNAPQLELIIASVQQSPELSMCVYNSLTSKDEHTGLYQGIIRQEIDGYVAYLPDLETLISVGEAGNAKLVLNGIREETFDLNAKVIDVNKDKTYVQEFNAIDIPSHPGQYINVDLNWAHGIEITAGNTHGNKITFNSDYTLTRDEFIKETAPINGNAGNNKVTAATAIVAGLSVAGALGVGYTLFAGRREEPEAEKQAMKKSDGGNASIGMLSISDAPKKPKEPSIAEETRDEVREREWTELKERRRKERLEEAEGKLPDVPEEPKRNASEGMWGNLDEPKEPKRKAPAVTGMWGQSYDEEFNNLSRDEIREREWNALVERRRKERLEEANGKIEK